MGKLYDRKDLEFDLAAIDQLESEISVKVAAGTFPALRVPETVALFDKERVRCRMALLRSGQLVRDLRGALTLFRACRICRTNDKGEQVPCAVHRLILFRAGTAIHWAVKENLARRVALGISRPNDDEKAQEHDGTHDGTCNPWERWYLNDVKAGIWPGFGSVRDENLHDFGLGYSGWLAMLKYNEEITPAEYDSELARLRENRGEG